MHPAPDPVCLLALGLTALLALRTDGSEAGYAAPSLPVWTAPAALVVFAVCSGVLGVVDPESFAAAFGAI